MQLTQRIVGSACILASLFFARAAVGSLAVDAPAAVATSAGVLVALAFLSIALLMGSLGVAAVLSLGRASDGLLAPLTFGAIGLAFSAFAILVGVPLHVRLPGRGTIVLLGLSLVAVTSIVSAALRAHMAKDAA